MQAKRKEHQVCKHHGHMSGRVNGSQRKKGTTDCSSNGPHQAVATHTSELPGK
jgi:hypothetical protein